MPYIQPSRAHEAVYDYAHYLAGEQNLVPEGHDTWDSGHSSAPPVHGPPQEAAVPGGSPGTGYSGDSMKKDLQAPADYGDGRGRSKNRKGY